MKHSRTNDVYAVKLLTKKLVSRTDRERALREVKVVADLPEHPNVVSYYRGWQEDRRLHIQMEYCPRGTLSGMLAGYQAKRTLMPELEVWRVARDVAGALGFIHAHGIVHLDLKPDNIFVCDKTFKLGDFGLAISLRSGGRVEWEEGDGDYVAPELLSSSTTLPTPAADMYSLGATLYECATGMRLPRGGRSAGLPVTLPHSSCGLGKLVRSLLVADPGARLTAQEVLDGINNLLGNRLPPIPQLRRDSKGWGAFPMAGLSSPLSLYPSLIPSCSPHFGGTDEAPK